MCDNRMARPPDITTMRVFWLVLDDDVIRKERLGIAMALQQRPRKAHPDYHQILPVHPQACDSVHDVITAHRPSVQTVLAH